MKRYEEASNAEKHQIENAIASSPVWLWTRGSFTAFCCLLSAKKAKAFCGSALRVWPSEVLDAYLCKLKHSLISSFENAIIGIIKLVHSYNIATLTLCSWPTDARGYSDVRLCARNEISMHCDAQWCKGQKSVVLSGVSVTEVNKQWRHWRKRKDWERLCELLASFSNLELGTS